MAEKSGREGQRENPLGGERKSVGAVERRMVGGDGNMCVGVFYTSVRGRMEVSGRGMGPS